MLFGIPFSELHLENIKWEFLDIHCTWQITMEPYIDAFP